MEDAYGSLYICPTPIGNLEDITLRALRILKEVDLIAAEDTRVTVKLLNHYDIKTAQKSYHEHNEKNRAPEIIDQLRAGKDVALVTDAGTPGISDPGTYLIRMAVQAQIPVVPLPGAVAAICALVASGLDTRRFAFEGFLPRRKKDRQALLEKLEKEERTMVFYEAPHRIRGTLKDLKKHLGDRPLVIAREITKLYEDFIRGSISEVLETFKGQRPRGEMVLVVEGAQSDKAVKAPAQDPELIVDLLKGRLEEFLEKGYPKGKALGKAAQQFNLSRNEAYDILLEDKEKDGKL